MKDAEVLALNSRLTRRPRQHFELFRRLFAKLQPFQVRCLLIGEFLPPRLNGKILLRESNLRLSRIAILSNQVTSKPRKLEVPDFPLSALTDGDHFAGAGKMMGRLDRKSVV